MTFNQQTLRKLLSSLSISVITAGVALVSGQGVATAQGCNVFGCSAPGAAPCNVFGCPAPGAAPCDVFGCPAPPTPPAPPASSPSTPEKIEEFRDFSISNRTGRAVERLYLSPSGDTGWGADELGNDVFLHGDVVVFGLNSSSSCMYDILAVLSNGREVDERQVDTCDRSRFTIQ
ncbi:MAG: hypothetical protein AAFZ17_02645 [Cyanobacteria bacterium J06650_10]